LGLLGWRRTFAPSLLSNFATDRRPRFGFV
jgi:hypothetical protein